MAHVCLSFRSSIYDRIYARIFCFCLINFLQSGHSSSFRCTIVYPRADTMKCASFIYLLICPDVSKQALLCLSPTLALRRAHEWENVYIMKPEWHYRMCTHLHSLAHWQSWEIPYNFQCIYIYRQGKATVCKTVRPPGIIRIYIYIYLRIAFYINICIYSDIYIYILVCVYDKIHISPVFSIFVYSVIFNFRHTNYIICLLIQYI